MELFNDIVPKTTENFRVFCTGETRNAQGHAVGYKNCKIHRVSKGFVIQGGDFIRGDGSGSATIYGPSTFADENFDMSHDEAGLLSMANAGPDTNGCQFFITLAPASHLNGKHVVFGKLLPDGSMSVVRKIAETQLRGDTPVHPVVISECGEY